MGGASALLPAHDASWGDHTGASGSRRPRGDTHRMTKRHGYALLAAVVGRGRGPFGGHLHRCRRRRRQRQHGPTSPAPARRTTQPPPRPPAPGSGTWSASPAGRRARHRDRPASRAAPCATSCTPAVGGTGARITLSNLYGQQPLTIAHATIAVAAPTDTPGGRGRHPAPPHLRRQHGSWSSRPGGQVMSDAVRLRVPHDADVLVTTYSPTPSGPVTYHPHGPPDLLRRRGRPHGGRDRRRVHRADPVLALPDRARRAQRRVGRHRRRARRLAHRRRHLDRGRQPAAGRTSSPTGCAPRPAAGRPATASSTRASAATASSPTASAAPPNNPSGLSPLRPGRARPHDVKAVVIDARHQRHPAQPRARSTRDTIIGRPARPGPAGAHPRPAGRRRHPDAVRGPPRLQPPARHRARGRERRRSARARSSTQFVDFDKALRDPYNPRGCCPRTTPATTSTRATPASGRMADTFDLTTLKGSAPAEL